MMTMIKVLMTTVTMITMLITMMTAMTMTVMTNTKPIFFLLGDSLPQSSAFDNDDDNDDNDDNDYKADDNKQF